MGVAVVWVDLDILLLQPLMDRLLRGSTAAADFAAPVRPPGTRGWQLFI
jgi:hypothetical protein